MLLKLRSMFHTHAKKTSFLSSQLNCIQTLKMQSPQPKSKRPTCPQCSKPLKLCLCSRLNNTALENSVHVTILQHSLEKNHPLNTTRIAKLGLKNLTVVTVCDVLSDVRFEIQLLAENSEKGFDGCVSDCSGSEKVLIFDKTQMESVDFDLISEEKCELVDVSTKKPDISAIVDKFGVVGSIEHPWMDGFRTKNPSFSESLKLPVVKEALAKGFVVRKIRNLGLHGSSGLEECEEFELLVPPGSALLFPTDDAVDVGDGLRDVGIEVKNLIVLDGTWAKAKRMYKGNPWLQLLPHLKLNLDKMSLYGEVRYQPKPGYLSTIESIVYTLKAIGSNPDGLDKLLDVFESMVEDQRRCKDERLSNAF